MKPPTEKQLQILDECLDRILAGEMTLETCQRAYPEAAQALGEWMDSVGLVKSVLVPTGPRPGFVDATETRLMNRMRAARPRKTRPARRRSPSLASRLFGARRLAFALASVLLAFLMLTSSVGVALASEQALPGDLLYGVKRGLEEARIALAADPIALVELLGSYADRRLSEIEALAAAGRQEDLPDAVTDYGKAIDRLSGAGAALPPESKAMTEAEIDTQLARHLAVLERVQQQVPPQAQEALARVIARSEDRLNNDFKKHEQQERKALQEERQQEREAERDQRTAEQIARQHDVSVEEVWAIFNGPCGQDWKCVRDYYRDLRQQDRGNGNGNQGNPQNNKNDE